MVVHPKEVKFRIIQRYHHKSQQDIGRHFGGLELLIAAGFDFEMIDDVLCYFSKEPNIEHEMDKWFDLMKLTLEIIEEDTMK